MSTSRYNPVQGLPYGTCRTCQTDFETKEMAEAHMSQTHDEARKNGGTRGHTISVTNPERPERIRGAVSVHVESAMDSFCQNIDDIVQAGYATEEELTKAMAFWPDFQEAWENWVAEDRD